MAAKAGLRRIPQVSRPHPARTRAAGKAKPHALSKPATAFGPAHIGTFGGVARTTWVRRAFAELSDKPARLIAFSDAWTACAKYRATCRTKKSCREFLGMPLTKVPIPFAPRKFCRPTTTRASGLFSIPSGFEYEFLMLTNATAPALRHDAVLKILAGYDRVMEIMLPTLGRGAPANLLAVLAGLHPTAACFKCR